MSGPWAEQPIVIFVQNCAGDISATYAPDPTDDDPPPEDDSGEAPELQDW